MTKLNSVSLEGVKFDQNKPRMELFPSIAMEEISKVLTFGAGKYEAHNWQKGLKWGRLAGAALRHIYAWLRGEDTDSETGLSHLSHAGCCIVFLIHLEQTRKDLDDRSKVDQKQSDRNTI